MCLTLFQTKNFRLFQIQRACRQQFQIRLKWQKFLQTGRKHCGRRRNCSLGANSPFLTVFKRPLLQTCENLGLFGKGLNIIWFSSLWKKNTLSLYECPIFSFTLVLSLSPCEDKLA